MYTRTGRKEWIRIPLIIGLGVGLLLALLISLSGSSARAAGTFTVNTLGDSEVHDSYLSFREAIRVSQGTLTSGFTDGEKTQLAGCTFSGSANSWTITGGCGYNITDTIQFSYASGVISLNSALPNIANDPKATYIYGPSSSTVELAIDATNLSTYTVPLRIYNDYNRIWHLSIRNARADALRVYGDHNNISYDNIYGNDGNGILISGGDNNLIDMVNLGFRDLDAVPSCTRANLNGLSNILVTGGAVANTIEYNSAGCALVNGITITGTATISNVVDNNYLGTYYKAGGLYHLSNSGDGIAVSGGSDGNQIQYNVIGFNHQNAVRVSGDGTDRNVIYDNDIGRLLLAGISNQQGVLIEGGAQWTEVLTNSIQESLAAGVVVNSSDYSLIQGNTITNNTTSGIVLRGDTALNKLSGNEIYSNGAAGIQLLDTATLNSIEGDIIHDNTGAGIVQAATAMANFWQRMSVYDNGGLGIDLNANGTPDGPFATITSCTPHGSQRTFSGKADPASEFSLVTVDLYIVSPDPTGFGEGKTWVNSTTPNSSGNWQIAFTDTGEIYTATQSRILLFIPIGTSEFGPNYDCFHRHYLPIVTK